MLVASGALAVKRAAAIEKLRSKCAALRTSAQQRLNEIIPIDTNVFPYTLPFTTDVEVLRQFDR